MVEPLALMKKFLVIMQIFEQLHDTGEGYQKGWLSPAVRRREFTPCKHCGGRTINL